MAIPLHTNINTNAPRPLDAKTVVGPGQQFLSKEDIPTQYRYEGLRVLDNNFIEWEYYRIGANYYWRNISFGAKPFIYKFNNTLLNPWNTATINNLQVGETLLFDAITFGNIRHIEWKIIRNNVTLLTSNKESFSYNLPLTGTYTVTLKVIYFNGYEVIEPPITLFNVSQTGIVNINQFIITPQYGLKQQTLRTYNFNIVLNEVVNSQEISNLNISYKILNSDTSTSVNLISSGNAVDGISINNTSILLDGSKINDFNNVYFENSMEFTATILKTNGQTATATSNYISVNLIDINEDVSVTYINYNTLTKTVSGQVQLVNAYSDCIVNGTITKNTTTRNLSSYDNKTFTFSFVENLNSGSYDYVINLTQTINSETYIQSITLQLNVIPTDITLSNYNIYNKLGYPDSQHKLLMSLTFSRNPNINIIDTFKYVYYLQNGIENADNLLVANINGTSFQEYVQKTISATGLYTFKVVYKESGMQDSIFSNTDSYLVTPKIAINSLSVDSGTYSVTVNLNKSKLSTSTYPGNNYIIMEHIGNGFPTQSVVTNYTWTGNILTFSSSLIDENTQNGEFYMVSIEENLGDYSDGDNRISTSAEQIIYTTDSKVYWGILTEEILNTFGYSVATDNPDTNYCVNPIGNISMLSIIDSTDLRDNILTDNFITNPLNILPPTGQFGYTNSNPNGYFATKFQSKGTTIGLGASSRAYSWFAVPVSLYPQQFTLFNLEGYIPQNNIENSYVVFQATILGSVYNIYVSKGMPVEIDGYPCYLGIYPLPVNNQYN